MALMALARQRNASMDTLGSSPRDTSARTVLQSGGVDLRAGGPSAGTVEGLHHHPVLGKLLQVVQGIDLAVARGLHLHDAILAIAARTVLPVPDLIAPNNPVLQLLFWGLLGRRMT